MSRTTLAVLACALTAFAGTAQAQSAGLSAVRGEVLIAGAKGFSPAKAGAALKPGDRIIARAGEARLTYADGCQATLTPGAMTTIAAKSPCAGGLMTTASGDAAQLTMPDISKWPPGAYIAGAGVAVIVGAIIYGLTGAGEDDDPPRSN